jgi:hypothetical protein
MRPTTQIILDTHPPANMRQRIVQATILENLIDSSWRKTFKKATAIACRDSERAFSLIHGRAIDPTQTLLAISPGYVAHSQKLLSNWKIIRPRLERFVRSGNLPP